MIDKDSSLDEICFVAAHALRICGINSVLTGGGAAAIYAPQKYFSYDADFILDNDDSLAAVANALAPLGFVWEHRSRIFSHPSSQFTIDFPKGPLAIASDYVRETATLTRGELQLRILTITDCIRDRLTHFYYWGDYTALDAAINVAAAHIHEVNDELIRTWTAREGHEHTAKYEEFRRRLHEIVDL
ncbi:MAG: hypothetical protein ACYDA5_07865 [Vulcanimicrobiaceae bacterium]